MRNYADEALPAGVPGDDARRHPDRVDLFAWQVADDAAIEVDGEATLIDPEPVAESLTLPARIPDRADDVIVAALPARRIQVYPGEVAELDVVLVNNGRQPAIFLVHVEGWFDEGWLAPPPPVTLQAGERSTVVLAIAPPRRPETEAGEYAIVVVVRSHDYPSRTARLGAQLTILPYDEITVAVLPAAQPGLTWFRRSTLLPVAIGNRGNRPAAVRLQAGDAQQRCMFEFFTPDAPAGTTLVAVRPGQTITTPLRVVAQHLPLVGLQSQHTPFFITASAAQTPDAVRRARGTVTLRPLIGPWLMASVTGLGMLAAVGVLFMTVIAFLVLRNGGGPTVVQAPASQPPQVIIVNLSQPVAAPPAPATAAASVAVAPASDTAGLNPALPLVLPNQVTAPDGAGGPAAAPPQPLPAVATSSQSSAVQTYAQMFQEVAQRFDMDWRMLAAQAYIESSFDSLALSGAGAMGLMQILPGTWREWAPGVDAADPFDSRDNVLVAAAYLDFLRTRLAADGHNGKEWMLVAYNWGPDRLDDFLAGGGTWENLPDVRRQYAEEILRIAQSIP
jgi:soluble lytic murein transglycosylase-like protein